MSAESKSTEEFKPETPTQVAVPEVAGSEPGENMPAQIPDQDDPPPAEFGDDRGAATEA